MANNHQGNLDHGLKIIEEHGRVLKDAGLRGGIKFQFRDLPDFVSKAAQEFSKNNHVTRFLSTQLSWKQFGLMKKAVSKLGLLSICTPFDEASVDKIVELGFDIIKVASCSANDWPLLEKIARSNLPIVASTGGLTIAQIDDLVSFFRHRACDFSLMHCVSIYPTPNPSCNLLNIKTLRERYTDVDVGWSTHEDQDESLPVAVAVALGATMFERHIGVPNEKYSLNSYSSTPQQLQGWLKTYKAAILLMGKGDRSYIQKEEIKSLNSLRRGVFAKREIEKGAKIDYDDIYFAFPCSEDQISAAEFKVGSVASKNFKKDQELTVKTISYQEAKVDTNIRLLKKSIHSVKAQIAIAKIKLGHDFHTEYSHHQGIENFTKVGAVLITIVNRDYAKKLVVQLPGQYHPLHMHKLKEETFIVLWGDLTLNLDGENHVLHPGQKITVAPGIWHSFSSQTGVIFEEISSTAYKNDSFYKDHSIDKLENNQRKTVVDHWGRFKLGEQLKSAESTT